MKIGMKEFSDLIEDSRIDVKTIFEIGSLNGQDACYLKKRFPDAKVYVFEGLQQNYETYLNKLEDVNAFNLVVFDYDGTVPFHVKNVNGIHSVFDRGQEYGIKVVVVPCKRVDTICREMGVFGVDVVKIDVEGATYEVLVGFGDMLKTVKVLHIETEDHEGFKGQKLDSEVGHFLTANNFILLKKSVACYSVNGRQFDSVWFRKQI